MKDKKVLVVLNFSLAIIAIILVLNLFEFEFIPLGKAVYQPEEMLCVVNWQDNYNLWNDINSCCLEVRKQLSCEKDKAYYADKTVNWRCQTGELKYWLNDQTYDYCKKTSIW
jgi:hypothetical protein